MMRSKEELRAEYEGTGIDTGCEGDSTLEWSHEIGIAFMRKLSRAYYSDTK